MNAPRLSDALLAQMADAANLGLLVIGRDGRLGFINRWAGERLRVAPAAALNQPLESAFGEKIDSRLLIAVRDALTCGRSAVLSHALHPNPLPLYEPGQNELRIRQAVTVTPLCAEEQAPHCLIQVVDMTATVRRELLLRQQTQQVHDELQQLTSAKEELRRSEQRFRELARQAPVGIFETDAHGNCLYVNDTWCAMTGLRVAEAMGEGWKRVIADEDREQAGARWREALAAQLHFAEELRFCNADGQTFWVRIDASTLRGSDGMVSGYIGTVVDVTHAKQQAMQHAYRASHDLLTGLANRGALLRWLDGQLGRCLREGGSLALLFIDLNRFKSVNDDIGHASGDITLREVARRLRLCVRTSDLVARYGGDEFVVALADVGEREAIERIAGKILQTLAQPIDLGEQEARIGAAIGICTAPNPASDPDDLLRRADAAMYQVKRTGQDNYAFAP